MLLVQGEIKVSKEPVPVSQAAIPGCADWLEVTLDDGRKYFYNGKTEACGTSVHKGAAKRALLTAPTQRLR